MSRRISQLDLSLAAEVSQRHISFLESGRAKPSRAMVQQLGEALDLPLRERNRLLISAGFAPVYEARSLDNPAMSLVMDALTVTLKYHEPNPALVLDRNWNIVMQNAAMDQVLSLMGKPETMWQQVCPDGSRNLLKLTFHPDGLRDYLTNWQALAAMSLMRIRREAESQANDTLSVIVEEILSYPGISRRWRAQDWNVTPPPVIPIEYRVDSLTLRLFSMISVFGATGDVTTDELRVESFFPADEASAALLRSFAGREPLP